MKSRRKKMSSLVSASTTVTWPMDTCCVATYLLLANSVNDHSQFVTFSLYVHFSLTHSSHPIWSCDQGRCWEAVAPGTTIFRIVCKSGGFWVTQLCAKIDNIPWQWVYANMHFQCKTKMANFNCLSLKRLRFLCKRKLFFDVWKPGQMLIKWVIHRKVLQMPG